MIRAVASPGGLGVGTWAWGDRKTWGYGREYDETDLARAFHAAIESHVTLFDTAELYGAGLSERLLGRFLRTVPESDRPVIASKFMPLPWRVTDGSLVRALKRSLERLRLSRLDLYLIHRPLPPRSATAWMDALATAVSLGLTRHVGVSNYTASQIKSAHALLERHGVKLHSVQVAYNLLHRNPEFNGVLDTCRQLSIAVLAHNPLAAGLLTGKYGRQRPPRGPRGRLYGAKTLDQVEELVRLLRLVGQAHGDKTPAQVALNWLIARDVIPIPGAKSPDQVRENVGARGWHLSADTVAILDRATTPAGDMPGCDL